MYINRALESVVRRYSSHFKVVAVTGPRQAGKTTMLRHLADEDAAAGRPRRYVSLDDTSLRMAARSEPALFLERYSPPVLIDEIQKAPELVEHIKLAADASDETGAYWITGSQPLHLMKEVSESLAGRVGILELGGLSLSEVSGVEGEPFAPGEEYFSRRARAARRLTSPEVWERIFAGSLPGIACLPDDVRAGAWESYLDTYVMRDIRDLAQVGDELRFRRFLSAAAALTARPVVFAELARLADVDEKTAKSWLSILVSTHLVKVVAPFADNRTKRLSKRPVMHFCDTGLAAHLAGWSDAGTLELGAMAGQLFESWVFSEIAKSWTNAGIRPALHFFRTNDKHEIDLLVERDGKLHPVEVKKSASPTPADARHFSALDPTGLEVGVGAVVCQCADAFPLAEGAWAFPAWAI